MSERVLIVAADSKPSAKLLRAAGFDVETAAHAFDGLEKVLAFAPQLAIVELAVRGMDGLRFCQHVLASAAKPAVIAIAEADADRTAASALRLGVFAYLTKPVEPELLQILVARGLADRVMRHQVEALSACVHDLETSVDRPVPAPALPAGMPPVPGSTLAELERYAILSTLKATNGSTSRTAKMLGLSTRTIQYRMHLYNARGARSEIGQCAQESQ